MNKVILSGNLCQDIELKQTPQGKAVVTNCVAVRRDFKNANGEYESDFINIVVWGSSAEYMSRNARKGDRVELVGSWTVRKYQANDGSNRIVNECKVESITVFSKPTENTKPANQQYMPSAYTQPRFEKLHNDTDLPF